MPLLKPGWMQAAAGDTEIVYSAQEDRASVIQSIFSREGVLDVLGGDLKVRQRVAGASYQIEVQAGRAAIRGDDVSDQGTYVVPNSTAATLTVPTSTSSQRTHQVVARVRDKLMNSFWTTYDWVLAVLPDTSLSAAQALPSTIVLATVIVPAGAAAVTTSMITDQRRPARIGTPALEGAIPLPDGAYGPLDSARAPRYAVNPDGWVQLSGALRRTGGTSTVAAGSDNLVFTEPVSTDICPADNTLRDFLGMTREGPIQFTLRNDRRIVGRVWWQTTFTQNATWINFDGCGYRL